jgi:hypothetical protein
MTITYVGAGTSVAGLNSAVTPIAHASTLPGDFVIVQVSIRNVAATFSTPSGWTRIAGTNHQVYGRIWQTGDVIPAFTPTGGSATNDTIASTITLRGVEAGVLAASGGVDTSPVQANASAQNVAYPALTVPGANHVALMFLWKASSASSYTTPAGWTAGSFLASTTAGDDASQLSYYQIQTTATNITAGSVVATGGTPAISGSIMLYLRPAAAIVVAEQPSWPARVLVTVSGLTLGDSISVYREVEGEQTLLRAGSSTAVTDPSFLVLDAELPFGVEVTYVAIVNGDITYTSVAGTYELEGGKVAVTDALTGLAAEAVIQQWTSKTYERRNTTFRVGRRNVVVSGALGQYTSQLTLYTETTTSADNLMDVLEGATGGTVQIRQPGGYDDTDGYVVVTRAEKTRYDETDGLDERRLFVLDVVETDPWSSSLAATGYTLQDLADQYAGLTLNDLAGDYSTLLQLSQAVLE